MTPPAGAPGPAGQPAVRPANACDADDIHKIQATGFSQAWPASDIARLFESDASLGLIATLTPDTGARTVGYVLATHVAGEAEILSIAVAPTCRRRGVASRLLTGLVTVLAGSGIRRLFLEVRQDDPAARALYTGLGFREAGRRAGYYAREGSKLATDAIVMRLDLEPDKRLADGPSSPKQGSAAPGTPGQYSTSKPA